MKTCGKPGHAWAPAFFGRREDLRSIAAYSLGSFQPFHETWGKLRHARSVAIFKAQELRHTAAYSDGRLKSTRPNSKTCGKPGHAWVIALQHRLPVGRRPEVRSIRIETLRQTAACSLDSFPSFRVTCGILRYVWAIAPPLHPRPVG